MSVGTTYGKYFLLKKLASGGMGEVYLARQQGPAGFEKVVVIKRILDHLTDNADYLELFLQEARLQARMNHSSIVQIFDLGQAEDESFYLAMEFVHGKSLVELLTRLKNTKQRLPPQLAALVIERAAEGLSYAHNLADNAGRSLNIIHRDISPHNVLISYQGDVKLIDFGIAKSEMSVVKTETGTIKGKFYYMSPEQSAAQPLDKRSDIFSLGIVLYECLAGENPFWRNNVVLSLEAIQKTDPPPLASIDPALAVLDPIVSKALAKDREQRYGDASDLKDDLVRARAQLPPPAERLGPFISRVFKDKLAQESKILLDTDSASLNALDSMFKGPQTGSGKARAMTGSNPKIPAASGSGPKEKPAVPLERTPVARRSTEPSLAAIVGEPDPADLHPDLESQATRIQATPDKPMRVVPVPASPPVEAEAEEDDEESGRPTVSDMPAVQQSSEDENLNGATLVQKGLAESALGTDSEEEESTDVGREALADEQEDLTAIKKPKAGMFIGIAAAVLLILAGGGYVATRGGDSKPTPPPVQKPAQVQPSEQDKAAEEARKAEEQKRLEEEKKQEEARQAEAAKKAAEDAKANEAAKAADAKKAAEDAKKAEAARAADEKRAAEEARKADAARKADEKRAAEEARKADAARKAEEKRAADEARKAEAKRKAEEQKKVAAVTAPDTKPEPKKSAGTLLIKATPSAQVMHNGRPVAGVKVELNGNGGNIDLAAEGSPFKIHIDYGADGSLVLNSDPWAITYVNNLSKGKTPTTVSFEEETMRVEFKRPGQDETVQLILRYSRN